MDFQVLRDRVDYHITLGYLKSNACVEIYQFLRVYSQIEMNTKYC